MGARVIGRAPDRAERYHVAKFARLHIESDLAKYKTKVGPDHGSRPFRAGA
jgi:hypothetical protein